MKAYKTYAEAKLAHPYSDIYTRDGEFKDGGSQDGGRRWVKANPADHLMSMEEFLESGYLLDIGDSFIGRNGDVIRVRVVHRVNKPDDNDCYLFILSAACFGGGSHPVEAKKKTRFRYVDVDFKDTAEFIDDDLFLKYSDYEIVSLYKASAMDLVKNRHKLCRRIEEEIDPVEEVARWLYNKTSSENTPIIPWEENGKAGKRAFERIAKAALENGFKLPDTN